MTSTEKRIENDFKAAADVRPNLLTLVLIIPIRGAA
jgi:hypothetical protein